MPNSCAKTFNSAGVYGARAESRAEGLDLADDNRLISISLSILNACCAEV